MVGRGIRVGRYECLRRSTWMVRYVGRVRRKGAWRVLRFTFSRYFFSFDTLFLRLPFLLCNLFSFSYILLLPYLSSGYATVVFSCYARFPIGAYYICPPNNMDGKMQNCKVQMKFTL